MTEQDIVQEERVGRRTGGNIHYEGETDSMKSDESFRDNLEEALAGRKSSAPAKKKTAAGSQRTSGKRKSRIDVFISYSSKNKNVADAVVSDFEQHGIRCWYAPRDIVPGQEWVSAIHDAITACRLFVLIYTDSSNESKQVANEVALAFNSGKTLIPFRLSDAEMSSELEYYLTRVHWLDAVNPPLRQSIRSLREYSERILDGETPEESKIRNARSGGSGGQIAPKWLYPVLAVLAIAAIVAIVWALTSQSGNDKPSGAGGTTPKPTDTAVAVTATAAPTATDVPKEDPKVLYEKAYGLQMSGKDRAVYDEAYECYMETGDALSADEKIVTAMFALASYYYESGTAEDEAKGMALYQKAAACGSARANNFLGNYYLEIDKEHKQEGKSQADTEFGGTPVSQDLYEAISYYVDSAEMGDAVALYSLGLIFENAGGYYTIEPDYEMALAYYERAELAGHAHATEACERVRRKM